MSRRDSEPNAAYGRAPERTEFESMVLNSPGGSHVLPFVNEGPYWVIVVTEWDEPTLIVEAALDAYPGEFIDEGVLPELGDRVFGITVHAVPQYVKELCEWYSEECELAISEEELGPFDSMDDARAALTDFVVLVSA